MSVRKYIDDEFEELFGSAIHGVPTPGQKAVFKMCFLAGMAAAVAFGGTDVELKSAIKPALLAISEKFGGRKLFPF